jgi:hypothetical protein
LPSHEDPFNPTVDETKDKDGIPTIQFEMIMLTISKALRRFVTPFHAKFTNSVM